MALIVSSCSTRRRPRATFWVKLDDLNLAPGELVRKLELVGGMTYSGNAVDEFVDAALFEFASLHDKFERVEK